MAIILPIITGLLLLYADFQSKKKLKKDVHGQFLLKLNSSYKWVGIICCLLGSFLLNMAISNWNEEIYPMASIVILMFFGPGIIILTWYYNYEVIFDNRRIIATNWRRKKRTINWTQIDNINSM